MPTPTYIPLAYVTPSDGRFFISFSNISQLYKDLVLVATLRSTRNAPTDVPAVRINGDTGQNYPWVNITGSGSTTGSSSNTLNTYLPGIETPAATAGSDDFGIVQWNFMDYSATDKRKAVFVKGGIGTGGGIIQTYGASWANTAAITQIDINYPYNSGLVSGGSSLALYGVNA